MNLMTQYCDDSEGSDRQLYIEMLEQGASQRAEVEDFIHGVFSHAYAADIRHFLPRLLALRNSERQVLAALGMREAADQRLFLETYLDEPIEAAVSRLQGSTVSRDTIVEVGNLASVHRGGLRHLIIALTAYLSGAGTEWVVFTAVPAVRNAFAAMGLPLQQLAVADKARLDKGQENWGSYYDTGPVVLAGRVEEGFQRLCEAVRLESAFRMSLYLWECAYVEGCRQRLATSLRSQPLAIAGGMS